MVDSSKGSRPRNTSSALDRSMVFVHEATRMVATALPEKFVSERASDMNRSIPTISPTPSSSSGR
ncbi:Uncharacterised protein [Mycobacterium tuberculosis]|nr:Uncharacterised protein [Mycobacterium tuberculosis]COW65879.1 Uncharacterised protein [Mycobacterium tuberculosis]COX67512.1 Uncharacterised protein [Mycobacterium tuberculosis]COY47967.1 Uncharacterised protein [Mycobacterium tuberculosis]COY99986.1 Uncharacterised protein [Mycobacterium tuberculosis]